MCVDICKYFRSLCHSDTNVLDEIYKYLFKLEVGDLSIIIHENFGNCSLGEVPSPPSLKILMETMCSAVQLLVGLTVVESRSLLGSQQVCRDIPRIIPGQV